MGDNANTLGKRLIAAWMDKTNSNDHSAWWDAKHVKIPNLLRKYKSIQCMQRELSHMVRKAYFASSNTTAVDWYIRLLAERVWQARLFSISLMKRGSGDKLSDSCTSPPFPFTRLPSSYFSCCEALVQDMYVCIQYIVRPLPTPINLPLLSAASLITSLGLPTTYLHTFHAVT